MCIIQYRLFTPLFLDNICFSAITKCIEFVSTYIGAIAFVEGQIYKYNITEELQQLNQVVCNEMFRCSEGIEFGSTSYHCLITIQSGHILLETKLPSLTDNCQIFYNSPRQYRPHLYVLHYVLW